jgi:Mannosyltransferase (PIG-V)
MGGVPVLEPDLQRSLAAALGALAASRLLVWGAGLVALALFGAAPVAPLYDPLGLTAPFGELGDLLVAPAARWDSAWYLAIADFGYDAPDRPAFFPLYPLLLRAVGGLVGSPLAAGMLVSGAAAVVAFTVLHRLAALELGEAHGRGTLMVAAFFPGGLFFSAVYTEALFLALSVGAIYAARRGRWALAGVLGALCACTRSVGLFVAVPILLLYLYGPRADRPGRALRRTLGPLHPIEPSALWILLVPLGLAAYMAYMGVVHDDPLAPFASQDGWGRRLTSPLGGVLAGADAAAQGARQILAWEAEPIYFPQAPGNAIAIGARHLVQFGFLLVAIVATVGVFRRLPVAYGAYVACSLALPLSTPATQQPLMSLPRFMAVLFPLHMWLALWAAERRLERALLVWSAVGLAAWSGLFTTWVWAG